MARRALHSLTILSLLTLSAAGLALWTSALLSEALTISPERLQTAWIAPFEPPPARARAPRQRPGIEFWMVPIVRRNIFDSGVGGPYPVPPPPKNRHRKQSREARIVPNFADGKTNGFKVFAIRRASALRKLGLKNNDVVTNVNGHDLSDTDKALEVYAALQDETSFTIELLRGGEPMVLTVEIPPRPY